MNTKNKKKTSRSKKKVFSFEINTYRIRTINEWWMVNLNFGCQYDRLLNETFCLVHASRKTGPNSKCNNKHPNYHLQNTRQPNTTHSLIIYQKWCRNCFCWIGIFVMCHYAYLSKRVCRMSRKRRLKTECFNTFYFSPFKYGILEPMYSLHTDVRAFAICI